MEPSGLVIEHSRFNSAWSRTTKTDLCANLFCHHGHRQRGSEIKRYPFKKEPLLTVTEDVSDAIEKNKLDEMIRQLRSAGAQYISAGMNTRKCRAYNVGQVFNANPTPENNEQMKNFDMIVGKLHTGLLRLMMQHSEGEFEVDPAQQRQYLLKEMNEALVEVCQQTSCTTNMQVREWQGQQEMMEIDAHAFYKAVDRLIRAYVSVIKNVCALTI